MKFNLNFFETELYQIPPHSLLLEEDRKAYIFLAQTASEEELDFLTKVMQAVGLQLKEDVQLLTTPPKQSVQISNIPLAPCFFFGVSPEVLGLHLELPLYQLVHYKNWQLLRGLAPRQIAQQKNHKLALWRALQEIFPAKNS